jgi:adenylosuccinate synthase
MGAGIGSAASLAACGTQTTTRAAAAHRSKAFSTCVGGGPLVTELTGREADALRANAHEFGAVTGRPGRAGHFDAVASRYGASIQGVTELALTKLDCLS